MNKHLLAILIMAAIPATMVAQQITYTYDEAGNCTSRTVTLPKPKKTADSSFKKGEDAKSPTSHSEKTIGGRNVSLVNNSQQGSLTIEILSLSSTDQCSLAVYDITGKQMYSTPVAHVTTTVDIGSFLPGYYILQVQVNGAKDGWKIQKE